MMDRYDYLILMELQDNGRISTAELGRKIGLSTTATKERIKKMEQEGIIKGYAAIIDGDKVGMDITAFISVPVGNMNIHETAKFLSEMPEVLECHKVTGDTCYLIKVKARNTKRLEQLIDRINSIARNTYTYLTLSTTKETIKINLEEKDFKK
ncbi:Lrp/AsnC family transcriptional regulator [Paramaledivibacter caminithermalis]|jgi:Lrp/AsnC family leucine-responsive transcriptional regulator|uniref:Lrp/AsnC family transcriptional regulator, leucine-responsive regulatory protein n=1 Tax=Paramaledivibacter caminithermalis (strain DSM 15212 / CIP 107654 / DViRD3) TaxID=1121301 RepID=A0A1M6R3E0_PARC5|nr:Lrp/AsnC family transcriptional regulator [Paramaledivibacter caminithermalis]SHK26943.1 Lrp/AsnC family transcriptional regulator, leucine-responsive regulatory protein [Paramaledivibacter caminithermalis DSM 15212]